MRSVVGGDDSKGLHDVKMQRRIKNPVKYFRGTFGECC